MSEQGPPGVGHGTLVARARAGDSLAFEELVRVYADRLHAVVRHLVDDQHEAEEVTQEAFLRAWRGIGMFKGDSQFFTWLYRIGVNESNRRTSRRRAPTTSLDEHLIEPVDSRPGPPRRIEQDDFRHALERAVRGLQPDQRAPLVLRDIEGLSTTQGAAILDLSEAAFKSRLHRARLAVREVVRDYLPEDPER